MKLSIVLVFAAFLSLNSFAQTAESGGNGPGNNGAPVRGLTSECYLHNIENNKGIYACGYRDLNGRFNPDFYIKRRANLQGFKLSCPFTTYDKVMELSDKKDLLKIGLDLGLCEKSNIEE